MIGAVTHVFIQDPVKGYGIFIENMLRTGDGGERQEEEMGQVIKTMECDTMQSPERRWFLGRF